MAYEYERTFQILEAGSSLDKKLRDHTGFELRMIIIGGQMALQRLNGCKYDMFDHHPTLDKKDWLVILKRTFLKK